MLKEYISQYVQVVDEIDNWEEAIKEVARPLVQDDCITNNYVYSMIQNIHKNGPYIVVMPGVALPHSRSEDGANVTCLSILKVNRAVLFPQDHKVHLIIALAAKDNDIHMQLLSELADIFMDEKKMASIFACETAKDLRAIL